MSDFHQGEFLLVKEQPLLRSGTLQASQMQSSMHASQAKDFAFEKRLNCYLSTGQQCHVFKENLCWLQLKRRGESVHALQVSAQEQALAG